MKKTNDNNDSNAGYTLINFGYNPWSDYWKRNQTIFHLLSRENIINDCIFVNSPVWLADFVKNPKREMTPPKINNWKAVLGTRKSDNTQVVTPLIFPFEYRFNLIKKISRYNIERYLHCKSNKKCILIINNPSDDLKELIEMCAINSVLTIFDWSDDFSQFEENEKEKEKLSIRINGYIERSDIVICVNEKLASMARQLNTNVYTIKNATNYFTFAVNKNNKQLPTNFFKIKSPVIGYMGWVNQARINTELIEYLASEKPDWNIVFVGPKSHVNALDYFLTKYPNIYLLDPLPYIQIPEVLDWFDICILPNNINEHTNGNDPIKIYDYLACGKPIVSTKTAGTEFFKHLLKIADTKEDFLNMINSCINEDNGSAQRIKAGYENSWTLRFEDLKKIIYGYLSK